MNTPAGGVTLPELKACPFCGSSNQAFEEGSTFRWEVLVCECGATAGECRKSAGRPAAITAWNTRAALAGEWRVPEGWRLVPVEPTFAMCVDGDQAAEYKADARAIYAAMLSAAPLPKEPGR